MLSEQSRSNSLKRERTYTENILDNKFIPGASHGINHVKHNLEYGYQLMCLVNIQEVEDKSLPKPNC